ncbi:MAG: hypothetical protein AAGF12_40705 [Myxococcota bacterium]
MEAELVARHPTPKLEIRDGHLDWAATHRRIDAFVWGANLGPFGTAE